MISFTGWCLVILVLQVPFSTMVITWKLNSIDLRLAFLNKEYTRLAGFVKEAENIKEFKSVTEANKHKKK
ncbi:UNVERIFIED_CONTAM: hypothetical protein NCL1_05309 [Trichonephila clavipes]